MTTDLDSTEGDADRPSISVVVPCFQEESTLGANLAVVDRFLSASRGDYEIIVVDDGSRDATAEAARATGLSALRVERYERNRGKGHAVRHGVASSRGDLILIMDADLSTPIEELTQLEAAIDDGYDVAIGSRALDRSKIAVPQAWLRDRLGRLFNLAVRWLGVPGFKDTQCGFKLFRGDKGRLVFSQLVIDRWAFDVEALRVALKSDLRIKEISVVWTNCPDSQVRVVADALGTLRDLIRIRFRWWFRRPRTASGTASV